MRWHINAEAGKGTFSFTLRFFLLPSFCSCFSISICLIKFHFQITLQILTTVVIANQSPAADVRCEMRDGLWIPASSASSAHQLFYRSATLTSFCSPLWDPYWSQCVLPASCNALPVYLFLFIGWSSGNLMLNHNNIFLFLFRFEKKKH